MVLVHQNTSPVASERGVLTVGGYDRISGAGSGIVNHSPLWGGSPAMLIRECTECATESHQ